MHACLRVLANELRQRDTVRSNPVVPNANRLFDALGPAARERLRPHVDLVNLTQGRVLSEPGDAPRYAFFPLDGMISLLASTEEGQALEVAMVGDDGFVGVPIVLNVRSSPYQVMVQVSSAAYRVHADAFAREFQRGEELHAIALTYVHGLMLQFVQSATCGRRSLIRRCVREIHSAGRCPVARELAQPYSVTARCCAQLSCR